jgi:hypothetical protein
MANMLISLESITRDYNIFEKDQVLTAGQLNGVTDYLDDQSRQTRVNLVGVGTVCGLRATQLRRRIRIGKGVGITTDGDLIHFSEDQLFDRFKPYDDTNPAYDPFLFDGGRIKMFELVPRGVPDERAAALSGFDGQLDDMVAVALMESYVKDYDICSGTDCDNLGKDSVNVVKILLVDKEDAAQLSSGIATPHEAFSKLPKLSIDRPFWSGGLPSTTAALAKPYKDACGSIQKQLAKALASIHPSCKGFVGDLFARDPAPAWIRKLATYNNSVFGNTNRGFQYYYDYLKDVAETYHAFRDELFGERTVCSPSTGAFPKHLLLGNLVPGTDADENRTVFYPSPAVECGERLERARFLLRKLDLQLKSFTLPRGGTIRITPSQTERHALAERAIPWYYKVSAASPLHELWSFRLNQRGGDTQNYSYHAGAYNGVEKPLALDLDRFGFFRIEGHLGINAKTAMAALAAKIRKYNLPIAVQTLFLGTDRGKIVVKPDIRYTDLHRFHHLLRKDLVYQVDDVKRFSGNFKDKVVEKADQLVDNEKETSAGMMLKNTAEEKHALISGKSEGLVNVLGKSFVQYRKDTAWKANLDVAVKAAGEFKSGMSMVAKTDFNTPFDTIIGGTGSRWVAWLDDIIKNRDDQKEERLLFAKFAEQHPGCGHVAGVPPGGTFVMVYDDSNKVVADFALPYRICETDEVGDEPAMTLPAPVVPEKDRWRFEKGMALLPSRKAFFGVEATGFEQKLNTNLAAKFDVQKEYINVLKDSVFSFKVPDGKVAGIPDLSVAAALDRYADKELGAMTNEVENLKALLAYYETQPGRDAESTATNEAKRGKAETEMAAALGRLGKHVAEQPEDVGVGTETYRSVVMLAAGAAKIRNEAARNEVLTSITETAGAQNKPVMRGMVSAGKKHR